MQTSNTKKTWGKPKLMILSRGTSDENVLTFCKYVGAPQGVNSLNTLKDACSRTEEGNCGACPSRAGT